MKLLVLKEWQKKWSWHFKLKSEKPQQLEVLKTWFLFILEETKFSF